MKNKKIHTSRPRLCRMLAALLVMALCLTGCAATEAIEGTAGEKSLTVALSARPTTMDPQMVSDVASSCCVRTVAESLYRMEGNQAVPGLAESYEMSPDGLTYTFHLREGLRFGNGDPIRADDFVFTFRRIADPEEATDAIRTITDACVVKNAAAVNAGELPLDQLGVSAPDERTVVIELERPCPDFLSCITDTVFTPCQEQFYDACNGHYASSPETMLYCGPFMVDRYQPLGTQIHFVKNPYYYDADQIKLDEITFQCITDSQQAIMCYQTGLVDMTPVKGEFITLAEGDSSLRKTTCGSFDYASFNSRSSNKACNNMKIRTALASAVNREDICEKLMFGAAVPLKRLFPVGVLLDENGQDLITDPEQYKDICSLDEEKARELFDQGLQELGADSIQLRVILGENRSKMAEVLKDEWEKTFPKLKLDIQIMQMAQLLEEMMGDDYDICLIGMTIDPLSAVSSLDLFKTGYAFNMGGHSNPEYDKLVDDVHIEMDPKKRNDLILKAEEIFVKDLPVIPLYSAGSSWLVADKVEDFTVPADDIINVTRVWKKS